MKDYTFVTNTGKSVPVLEMDLKDINDILSIGNCDIVFRESENETVENVLERLRIELVIRSLPDV